MSNATNHQITPIGKSLTQIAMRKSQDGRQLQGKDLPCHVVKIKGSIVTVAFDVKSQYTLPQMDMPIANSQYVREAIKVGDKGMASSADAYIGNNSGLGENTSNLSPRANLSNLVFHPIANKDWSKVDNDQTTHSSPNGTLVQTDDGVVQSNLTKNNIIHKADKKVLKINKVTDGNIAMSLDPGNISDRVYIGGDGKTGTYTAIGINVYVRTG